MGRIERRQRPISGMGGHLYITKALIDTSGEELGNIVQTGILDVGRWQVRHKHILSEVTHSGSLGAVKRAVVAADFQFAVACPWNARNGIKGVTVEGSDDGVLFGFLQEILTGNVSVGYTVGMQFHLGDHEHYVDLNGTVAHDDPAWMGADEVLVEDFNTICDATGRDVVRVDFIGWGKSLLNGWRGISPSIPELKFDF